MPWRRRLVEMESVPRTEGPGGSKAEMLITRLQGASSLTVKSQVVGLGRILNLK